MSQRCTLDTKCGLFSYCNVTSKISKYGTCKREPALYATPYSIFVFILIPPIIGIGILGGLGGGVIKRPLLEAMLNYEQNIAGQVTDLVIFASSFINVLILFTQKHPEQPTRPMINFELAIIYCLAIPISMNVGESLAGFMPLIGVLVIQMLFYFVFAPLFWFLGTSQQKMEIVKKSQSVELLQQSALLSVEQAKAANNQYDENSLKLYQQFHDESCSPFPVTTILIVLGNFLINELILLMRATPNQPKSVIFPSLKKCEAWDYYLLLILIAFNLIYTLVIFWYKRKQEFMKDTVNFLPQERYYTPATRFFWIYAAGWLAGFIAGLTGVAAGIVMVITMIEFGLISRVAASTANFCYSLIGLNLISQLAVNMTTSDSHITLGTFFFYFGLSAIAVIAFTNTGYILMNRHNIGYILCFFDFGLVILNIAANLAYGIEQGEIFGWDSLKTAPPLCD